MSAAHEPVPSASRVLNGCSFEGFSIKLISLKNLYQILSIVTVTGIVGRYRSRWLAVITDPRLLLAQPTARNGC